ncbi:MAG: ABC transporter substrate-binding protein [Alphaproteobacteria bacterium]|nr:ABC transporter substrate-binding protein [Alphaproteobacteria bacterium]
MRRRQLAVLLVAGLASRAAPVRAQAKPGIPRIGVLDWESPDANRTATFRDALRELGYVEGRNIVIEYSHAEGRTDRADALAAEMVRRPVSIIVAFATPAAAAAKRATSTIPIVVTAADPLGTGLVADMVRPGGNVTGVSNMMPDLESKRLELLRELLPGLQRVAFLGSTRDPATKGFVREAQRAAARSGLRLEPVLIGGAGEIDGALAAMARDKIDAVIVQPLFALNTPAASQLAVLAARHRVPAITNFAFFARSGGLASYGPEASFGRRAAARYVDRILKGARPGDLPVEQPTRFELVINLTAARALGLAIPRSVLARADEVVE